MAAKKLTPCYCSNFEAHVAPTTGNVETDIAEDITILTTNCPRQTHNTFAQGHDAKLVSFLVQWDLAGYEIHSGRNSGVLRSHDSAETAGYAISAALGEKAARAIESAQAKALRKEVREAEKAERRANKPARVKKADSVIAQLANADEDPHTADELESLATELDEVIEEAAATKTTQVKVGRWFYDATIDEAGNATYTNSAGSQITVEQGKYTIA